MVNQEVGEEKKGGEGGGLKCTKPHVDLTGSVVFVKTFSFCPAAEISVEIVNRLEKAGSHTDRVVNKTDTPVWRYW